MVQPWKSFAIGALSMFIVLAASYLFFAGIEKSGSKLDSTVPESNHPPQVTITQLPSLRGIHGNEVAFEGKAELRQEIAGRAARNLMVVNFQATGEHAEKSYIKIVWENGEVETVAPGTKDKTFQPDKRAVAISLHGYSMHERRIFRDSSRKGTLTWEIRYEPVE